MEQIFTEYRKLIEKTALKLMKLKDNKEKFVKYFEKTTDKNIDLILSAYLVKHNIDLDSIPEDQIYDKLKNYYKESYSDFSIEVLKITTNPNEIENDQLEKQLLDYYNLAEKAAYKIIEFGEDIKKQEKYLKDYVENNSQPILLVYLDKHNIDLSSLPMDVVFNNMEKYLNEAEAEFIEKVSGIIKLKKQDD